MKRLNLIFPALLFLLVSGCGNSGLEVSNAWIREVPPGIETTALYLDIKNNGKESDVLLSVESDIAGSVEIHRTSVNKDGISYMEKLGSVKIPASGSVSLEPGGIHIMLIGLTQKIKSGDKVDIVMVFEKSGRKKVSASVRGLDNS